jgi:hypothetical protein
MFDYQSWCDIGKEVMSKMSLPPVQLSLLVRDSGSSFVGQHFTHIAGNYVSEGMLLCFWCLKVPTF